MICNKDSLLKMKPLSPMFSEKKKEHGVSYGLSENGYDVRIAQELWFHWNNGDPYINVYNENRDHIQTIKDTFILASTIEKFNMPSSLLGIVHDKSTWAREGLAVQNTIIDSGFKGGLTLELTFQRRKDLHIPYGSGIAQILFHEVKHPVDYEGKYQNQGSDPTEAIYENNV